MDGQTDAQTKRADGWTDQRTHRPIKTLTRKNEGRGAKRKSWRKEREKKKRKKEKKKRKKSL